MLLGKADAGGVASAVVVAEHRLCPAGDSAERHCDNQHEALYNRVAGKEHIAVGAAVIFQHDILDDDQHIVEQDDQKRCQSQREDIAAYREGVTMERDFHRHGTAEQNVQRKRAGSRL